MISHIGKKKNQGNPIRLPPFDCMWVFYKKQAEDWWLDHAKTRMKNSDWQSMNIWTICGQ